MLCLLTYTDSLCHSCRSKYYLSQVSRHDDSDSNPEKVGTTAFAASVIWCINVRFMGPHAWDVRAVVLTSEVARVSNVHQHDI